MEFGNAFAKMHRTPTTAVSNATTQNEVSMCVFYMQANQNVPVVLEAHPTQWAATHLQSM